MCLLFIMQEGGVVRRRLSYPEILDLETHDVPVCHTYSVEQLEEEVKVIE